MSIWVVVDVGVSGKWVWVSRGEGGGGSKKTANSEPNATPSVTARACFGLHEC